VKGLRQLAIPESLIRPALIIRIVVLTMLIQFGISLPAWIPGFRDIPEISLIPFPGSGTLPAGITLTAFCAMILSCIAILFRPGRRNPILILLVSAAILVLADINRLQPWLYAYILILLPFVFMDKPDPQILYRNVIAILAFTYFWSGLHKINPFFPKEMFIVIADGFGLGALARENPEAGFVAAGLEMGSGILLIFRITRNCGLILAIAMHLTILMALGPVGISWNAVVWPWNICYILLGIIAATGLGRAGSSSGKAPVEWVVIFLVGAMPIANFFGFWPHFLSGSFYSSLLPNSAMMFPAEKIKELPPSAMPFLQESRQPGNYILRMDQWVLEDLHLPLFSEEMIHRKLGQSICKGFREDDGIQIVVSRRNRFHNETRYQIFFPNFRRATR